MLSGTTNRRHRYARNGSCSKLFNACCPSEDTLSGAVRQGLSGCHHSTLPRFSIACLLIACLPSRPGACDMASPHTYCEPASERAIIHSDSTANKTPPSTSTFTVLVPSSPALVLLLLLLLPPLPLPPLSSSCDTSPRHLQQCPLPLPLTVPLPQHPQPTLRCSSTPMLRRNK